IGAIVRETWCRPGVFTGKQRNCSAFAPTDRGRIQRRCRQDVRMAAFRSERIFGVTAEETLSLSSKDSERFHDFSNCFVQILLAPLRGANQFCAGDRGYRCAQPPATLFQPSGLGHATSRGLRGSLYFPAPSRLNTANRRLRHSRVLVTLVEAAGS